MLCGHSVVSHHKLSSPRPAPPVDLVIISSESHLGLVYQTLRLQRVWRDLQKLVVQARPATLQIITFTVLDKSKITLNILCKSHTR